MLRSVYGYHIHCNNGTHLYGDVADNVVWQRRWLRIRNLPTKWYDAPTGHVGCRFVKRLIVELKGVRNRKYNYDPPLVFVHVIFPMPGTVRSSKDIRTRVHWRLVLWDKGQYSSLVGNMVTFSGVMGAGNQLQVSPEAREKHTAQALNCTLISGRLRQAERRATGKEGGGVLTLENLCKNRG